MSRGAFALLVCLVGAPSALAAQDSVRLRFSPPRGLVLHRVFQRHQLVEIHVGTEAPRVHEVAQLGGITQAVLQADGEATGVHLAFDSLRLRTRVPGTPWSEVVVPGADTTWIQVDVGDQLQMALRAGELQPGGGGLLMQSLTGFPGVILPQHWLREGMQWRTELYASPSDPLIPGDMDDVVLRTRATFVVDSIVPRARDTLVHIAVGGTSVRLRRQLDDGSMLAYSGSLAGTFVWSTGYVSFVSAATRLNVSVDVRTTGTPEPVRRMIIETTMRQAVVP